MVDRYWRKVESVEDNIENSLQISSILLKLKGHDEKMSNLDKIGTNESNISFNLGKIGANETNIGANYAISQVNAKKLKIIIILS